MITALDKAAIFLARAEPEPNTGCLLWTGALSHDGYPKAYWSGWLPRYFYVHVFMWEVERGPVPDELELDHLCRVRHCINVRHLEPVTGQVNKLRGTGFPAMQAAQTECIHGHPLAGRNLYVWRGQRHCRTCRNANWLRLDRAKRGE